MDGSSDHSKVKQGGEVFLFDCDLMIISKGYNL
jgi:hypothetical protein